MAGRTLLIKNHEHGGTEMIRNVPDGVSATTLVERYQKRSLCFQVHHRLPGVSFKWAEKPGLVACLVESAKVWP